MAKRGAPPVHAADAAGTDVAEAPVGGGQPLRAYPNWDPERREFVLHTERDEGSNYESADEAGAPPQPRAASRSNGSARQP